MPCFVAFRAHAFPCQSELLGRVHVFCGNTVAHPHFEYPQFKQVAHPSMITTALVLHLWHMAADGGKDAPSPVTSMVSSCDPFSVARSATVGLTSGFFFEPCRCS